jgi:hypothetical protein
MQQQLFEQNRDARSIVKNVDLKFQKNVNN